MNFLCTFGRMVSKDTISAEGKLLHPVYWEHPQLEQFGFFRLRSIGSQYIVDKFIPQEFGK